MVAARRPCHHARSVPVQALGTDFTKGAMEASIKRGAVPIVLINGEMIVDIMIRTGFGVERRPLELYFDRLDTIFEDEA